jgi:hypothetical protein
MLDEFDATLLLTRKEAAAYKGLAGESSLRDGESRGLESATDGDGRALYRKAALDAWKVKCKEPTEARKRRVLEAAQKERAHEARERARRMAAQDERAMAEHDAWLASLAATDEEERRLRARVDAKNAERELAFRLEAMSEREIRETLRIDREAFRKFVRMQLIRVVEPPLQARVRLGIGEPSTEVEDSRMWITGGPFYSRGDVVRLRQEAMGLVNEHVPEHAPRGVVNAIAGALIGAFASDSVIPPAKSVRERPNEIENSSCGTPGRSTRCNGR